MKKIILLGLFLLVVGGVYLQSQENTWSYPKEWGLKGEGDNNQLTKFRLKLGGYDEFSTQIVTNGVIIYYTASVEKNNDLYCFYPDEVYLTLDKTETIAGYGYEVIIKNASMTIIFTSSGYWENGSNRFYQGPGDCLVYISLRRYKTSTGESDYLLQDYMVYLKRDINPPTINETPIETNNYGGWRSTKNNNYVKLVFEASDDTQIDQRSWQIHADPYYYPINDVIKTPKDSNKVELTFSGEGQKDYNLTVNDLFGRNSVQDRSMPEFYINIKIDNTPPTPVTGFTVTPNFYATTSGVHHGKQTNVFDSVNIQFNKSNDGGLSGVSKYQLGLTTENGNTITNTQTIQAFTQDVSSTDYNNSTLNMERYTTSGNVQTPNTYWFGIQAFDKVTPETNANVSNLTKYKFNMPPVPLKIKDYIYSKNPIFINALRVKYPVRVYFTVNQATYTNNYQNVHVYYAAQNGAYIGGMQYQELTILNRGEEGGFFYVEGELVDNDFIKHAHQDYFFFSTTVHKGVPAGAEEYGNDDYHKTVNNYSYLVPNYQPEIDVLVKKTDSNGSVDRIVIGKNGYIKSINGVAQPAGTFTFSTRDKIEFMLGDGQTNWVDAEGDELKLELMTINNRPFGDVQYGASDIPPFSLFYDRQMIQHCFVKIHEYSQQQELTALYDNSADYSPLCTYRATGTLFEGFKINWDFIEAYGVFKLIPSGAATGDTYYTVDAPTNSKDVRIYLSRAELDRMLDIGNGVIQSLNKISFFNVRAGEFDRPYEIQEADIAYAYNHSQSIGLSKLEFTNFNPPGDNWISDFDLSPGLDSASLNTSIRIVGMRMEDSAGNASFKYQIITMDGIPPNAPKDLRITGYDNAGNANIGWNDTVNKMDETKYEVTYPDSNGLAQTLLTGLGETTATVLLNGYGKNILVPVSVRAVDNAGNKSDPIALDVYTLSGLGNIVKTEQLYDELQRQYYIEWTLNSVAAKELAVSYCIAGSGNTMLTPPVPAANSLRLYGVTSGNTYEIKLLSYNESGFASAAPVPDFTVVNNSPLQPVITTPVNGSVMREDSAVIWESSIDPDGDVVGYKVYLREAGSADSFASCNVTETGGETIAFNISNIGGLENGRQYECMIGANDSITPETFSETRTFIYEKVTGNSNALISFNLPAGKIMNTETNNVSADVITLVSGISEIAYSISGGTNEIIDKNAWIIDGSGNAKVNIALPESSGTYNILLNVKYASGRLINRTSDNIWVDKIAPNIDTVSVDTDKDKYYTAINELNIGLEYTESLGVRTFEYIALSEKPANLSNLEGWTEYTGINHNIDFNGDLSDIVKTTAKIVFNGREGSALYFVFRLKDYAGNISNVFELSKPVLLDITYPQGTLSLTGCKVFNSGFYTDNPGDLGVNTNYEDAQSGIDDDETRYGVLKTGDEVSSILWGATVADALDAVSLTDGNSCQVAVRMVNNAGLSKILLSERFIYDASAPVNPALLYDKTKEFSSGETVSIMGYAEEPDSAIKEYRIAIGKSDNITALSSLLNGNVDGYLVKNNPVDNEFRFTLPIDIADGTYNIAFEAVNATGKKVTLLDALNSLEVDNSIEKLLLRTEAPYQAEGDSIKASWIYKGSKMITGYQYQISGVSSIESGWVDTDKTYIDLENLNLSNDTVYSVNVKGFYNDGSSIEASSGNILVDTKKPVVNYFKAPAACGKNNLAVSWEIDNDASGIASVELLVKKLNNNSTDIVGNGWIKLAAALSRSDYPILTDNNGNKLEFLHGDRLYLTLMVTDKAGNAIEKGSEVVVVDLVSPPAPVIADQGDFINFLQPLKASWMVIGEDSGSGIKEYKWKAANSFAGLEMTPWLSVAEGMQSVTLSDDLIVNPKANGDTWYFSVKSIDRAGNESSGISNGITYDNDVPFISEVMLYNGSSEERQYINTTDNLTVNVNAGDLTSYITSYKINYGVFNANGLWEANNTQYTSALPSIPLNPNPELQGAGIINYFKADCADGAVNQSTGFSKGIIYDTETPEISFVHGNYAGDELFFDWDVISHFSPVSEYEYKLLKDSVEMVSYSGTTKEKKLGINAENMGEGIYELKVRTKNLSGNYSDWQTSNKTKIDNSGPEIKVYKYNQYASSSISFEIEAEDILSGISEYQYKLGTFEEDGIFTTGWVSAANPNNRMTKEILFAELAGTIKDKSQIYLSIRVINGNGKPSEIEVSDAITVDMTAPVTLSIVMDKQYARQTDYLSGIRITALDPESGIAVYQTGIVELNQTDIQWNEEMLTTGTNVLALDITINGLSLSDGQAYNIAVKTKNKANLWSEIKYSDAVIVDLTPPEIKFTSGKTIVINKGTPNFTVPFEINENVKITFKLEDYDTAFVKIFAATEYAPGAYEFDCNEILEWGTYKLYAMIEDQAGYIINSKEENVIQNIRVNKPHYLIYTTDKFHTTAGKPTDLSVAVVDYDGDVDFDYQWEWYRKNGEKVSSEAIVPTFVFEQSDNQATETTYNVTVTVTDRNGISITGNVDVVVENTQAGQLYRNEYWSGNHKVTGNIIIPENITLTVAPGTTVIMKPDMVNSYHHCITVNGSILLDASAGAKAVFMMEEGNIALWKGIILDNKNAVTGITSLLCNVEIRNAERGLAIMSDAQITIDSCQFIKNIAGIHIPGVRQIISGCTFEDNLYGIKEEKGEHPVVKECVFKNNYINYYDQEKTRLSAEKLNAREGNTPANVFEGEEK